MAQNIKKIYLHWTGTSYDWAEPGHYHTVILGNGSVKRLTGYDQPLKAHTAGRNEESVAIAIACMGERGWDDYPPTAIQIENMCKEVALLAFQLGWKPDEINIYRVMTHAEAAANRDFPLEKVKQVSEWSYPTSTPQAERYVAKARALGMPHENYGPDFWFDGWPAGFFERWDLWQLKPSERRGEGGFILRDKIKKYLSQMDVPEISIKSNSPAQPNECKVYLDSQVIATGYILSDNRCYVQLSKLTAAFGIPLSVNSELGYINLLTDKFQPKYLADSPVILGYRVVDIYMNRPQDARGEIISDSTHPARPFMQGIIFNKVTYVLVADFCKELDIPFKFQSSDRSVRLSLSSNKK
ncbi:MAG: N-acetylmuramoyl-L-alanine amidase [Oscillatoriaceae bacterium SKW80]|nr:N-acetylmuramoyl-L-alanine amidase [Oscillatoriaceae bacterium SKYG93]MCX8119624.1 N-acetylmuramoyl-L-alanine amidase [Oscillatoriaceae bacterium SKW80]MDW8455091.1 N-acetylmuramoyl-L-alanine amidase [Oscillatoriaceae cyanobacterium SKYGB_i_bin93]HIK28133.1 N-acetylmuramoyl-L-alanine amidase [Oscillatoriaceae cyanobacterium M7585_C2015_266]